MSDEKTEQPTDKKLRDARDDGDTSKSTDLVEAVSMAAAIGVLIFATGMFTSAFQLIVHTALEFPLGDRDLNTVYASMLTMGLQFTTVVGPCLLAAAIGSVAALGIQVGFQIATKPAVPDLNHLNVVEGIKRIFSWKTLIELGKMLVKAIIIGCVMWFTITRMLGLIVGSLYQPLPQLSTTFWQLLLKLCAVATGVFIIIGAVDVLLQRTMFMRKMRMSKDEVKREHKDQEGDPRIKGERKRLARELVMNAAPAQRVGLANALIVNPTHYAVAIRYAPDEHPLPLVTAKGMDETAAQLRRFAQEASVPIIGNPPVARALYKVGVDEPIPEELFETVAAILRWVESIGSKTAKPPGAAPASALN
ncbi:type III secretion system export apparatus subunit SctU [Trinickia sp. LjRoot230]|uniref:type III secretion system export apparatus subunit SctU n=1 Tax=Trinickia sp. LjRoot230 TaxID=3342288 RepID=UPI003ECE66CD